MTASREIMIMRAAAVRAIMKEREKKGNVIKYHMSAIILPKFFTDNIALAATSWLTD